MKFSAEINIMPLKALLDPQGKAVTNSMHKIGFNEVSNVRVGKHITLEIEAESEEAVMKAVDVLGFDPEEGIRFSYAALEKDAQKDNPLLQP